MPALENLLQAILHNPQQTGLGLMAVLVAVYTASWVVTFIYRITFHPLARFPGPFLCRTSYLYQIYYEAFLNGRMLERLPELHRKYGTFLIQNTSCYLLFYLLCEHIGPVLRINPNEVHLQDPSLYHVSVKPSNLILSS